MVEARGGGGVTSIYAGSACAIFGEPFFRRQMVHPHHPPIEVTPLPPGVEVIISMTLVYFSVSSISYCNVDPPFHLGQIDLFGIWRKGLTEESAANSGSHGN